MPATHPKLTGNPDKWRYFSDGQYRCLIGPSEIQLLGYERQCPICGDVFLIHSSGLNRNKRAGTVPCCTRVCAQAQSKRMGRATHSGPGAKHPRWKGGQWLSYHGYLVMRRPGPTRRHVAVHRYVMEQHLGKELRRNELVTHKNGDKLDNRIENLVVVPQSGRK